MSLLSGRMGKSLRPRSETDARRHAVRVRVARVRVARMRIPVRYPEQRTRLARHARISHGLSLTGRAGWRRTVYLPRLGRSGRAEDLARLHAAGCWSARTRAGVAARARRQAEDLARLGPVR